MQKILTVKHQKRVKFLIVRKYPGVKLEYINLVYPPFNKFNQKECEEYKNYLLSLDDETISELCRNEIIKQDQEMLESLPKVNYKHWAKCKYWTIPEAICLSLGISPLLDLLKQSLEDTYSNGDQALKSPLALKISEFMMLVGREYNVTKDTDTVTPINFIQWAIDIGYPPHKELVGAFKLQDEKATNNTSSEMISPNIKHKMWFEEAKKIKDKYPTTSITVLAKKVLSTLSSTNSKYILQKNGKPYSVGSIKRRLNEQFNYK